MCITNPTDFIRTVEEPVYGTSQDLMTSNHAPREQRKEKRSRNEGSPQPAGPYFSDFSTRVPEYDCFYSPPQLFPDDRHEYAELARKKSRLERDANVHFHHEQGGIYSMHAEDSTVLRDETMHTSNSGYPSSEPSSLKKNPLLGDRHQADIPSLLFEKKNLRQDSFHPCLVGGATHQVVASNDEAIWLGTKIWPLLDKPRAGGKGMGKGSIFGTRFQREASHSVNCDCEDQGSITCVRKHVDEADTSLERKLGPGVYELLGFGDMGQKVRSGWAWEEEQIFARIVKQYPQSKGYNFWSVLKRAFALRGKSMRDLVSYYFNVFVVRRRAVQNRAADVEEDSDDDEMDLIYEDEADEMDGEEEEVTDDEDHCNRVQQVQDEEDEHEEEDEEEVEEEEDESEGRESNEEEVDVEEDNGESLMIDESPETTERGEYSMPLYQSCDLFDDGDGSLDGEIEQEGHMHQSAKHRSFNALAYVQEVHGVFNKNVFSEEDKEQSGTSEEKRFSADGSGNPGEWTTTSRYCFLEDSSPMPNFVLDAMPSPSMAPAPAPFCGLASQLWSSEEDGLGAHDANELVSTNSVMDELLSCQTPAHVPEPSPRHV